MAITDKQRIDFLARQKFTRWVGYDTENGYCMWPVFDNGDLRAEIDRAIKSAAQRRVQPTGGTVRQKSLPNRKAATAKGSNTPTSG